MNGTFINLSTMQNYYCEIININCPMDYYYIVLACAFVAMLAYNRWLEKKRIKKIREEYELIIRGLRKNEL